MWGDKPHTSSNTIANASISKVPLYDDGNFQEEYDASVATPSILMVEDQLNELQWNDSPMECRLPETNEEV